MAVFVNPRDQLLQATVPRVIPLPIDPETIPGLPGAIAATKGVRLIAPSTVFQISATGTPSPATITLTTLLTNVSGPIVWTIQNGTATLDGTGASRTLAAANMSTSTITIRATVSFEGSDYIADYTIAKVLDGANGSSGTPGTNTALVYAYMRSATAPTTNPGPVTWTFNVAAITTPTTLPNGWSKVIPAGTQPIYVTVATASSATNTDDIAANEWTTPVVLGSQGADGSPGLNSATVWLFTRSSSQTSPATPAGNLTYNFTTGLLTGTLGIWSQSVPLVPGTYLHVTTATAASSSSSTVIPPTAWTVGRVLAKDGQDGPAGDRGSLDLIGTLGNLTAYPNRPGGLTKWSNGTPSTANATAADNAARDVVWVALGNSGSAPNNAHLRAGDMITLKNTDETVVVTGYWGGSSWLHPGQILDGNLLVPGTVTAAKIDSRGLTIRMPDGTVVLDASRRLSRSDLTDLGVLAALNSVQLGTTQVTGNLPNTQITGLGALAVLNSVNLNTQTTGALNGLTQVTNLGGLAYANAVAANQIGAGVINAGHISAGAITTPALAAGSITADKLQVGMSGNMLPNSALITGTNWEFSDGIGNSTYGQTLIPWAIPVGLRALQIYQSAAGNTSGVSLILSHFVTVEPLKRYGFSVYVGAYLCEVQAYIEIYDATVSNWLVGSALDLNDGNTFSGGSTLAQFKLLKGFVTAPANGALLRLVILKRHTKPGGFTDSMVTITRPMVALAGPNQTEAPVYAMSGVGTLITPAGISTPNLSSFSAVIGLLRTSVSGQRLELGHPSNDSGGPQSMRVYDFNNVLRVRNGIW